MNEQKTDPALRAAALAQLAVRVPRPRRSLAYLLALVPVALVMVALPLLYVGLIVLLGWGMFEWGQISVEETMASSRSMRNWKGWLLMVVGPQFIGLVALFFLVKPLLAPRPRSRERVIADPRRQPFLYDFVGALCDAVGAPRPRRILLDHQPNASAGFHQGGVGLLTRERELTIGLALLQTMRLRQVAGILAHEFGHFSQGISMRLGFLVQSINLWFARVVHDRDAWDERLDRRGDLENTAIGIVVKMARGMVWLTRRLLAALMWIGRLVSAHLSRQMEHDADRFEVQLAGSAAFEASMRQLVELGQAEGAALRSLQDGARTGDVVTTIPGLIARRHGQMPEDFRARLAAHIEDEELPAFASHPRSIDRIRRAAAADAPGSFELDAPAAILLDDFDAMCAEVTADQYRRWLGDDFEPERRLEPEAFDARLKEASAERDARNEARQAAFARFYQGCDSMLMGMVRPAPVALEGEGRFDGEVARQVLQECRDALLREAPAFRDRVGQMVDVMNARIQAKAAAMLYSVGATVDPTAYGLQEAGEEAAKARETELGDELARLREASGALVASLDRRLGCVGRILDQGLAPRAASGEALPRFQAFLVCARAMGACFDAVNRRVETAQLTAAAFDSGDGDGPKVGKLLRPGRAKLLWKAVEWEKELLERLQRELGHLSYPWGDGSRTLLEVLLPDGPPQPDDNDWLEDALDRVHRGFHEVYDVVLTELAEVAEAVEGELGLEPLPAPPPRAAEEEAEAEAEEGVA